MKWFLALTSLFVGLMSASAFADQLFLVPNDGGGGNFAFVGEMNGHALVLNGGLSPDFFSAFGYEPGAVLGGQTDLFLDSTIVWVDGAPMEFFFHPGILFMSSFTLPTNGKDFTVYVQIDFFDSGFNFDTGQTVDVSGGGAGNITFEFFNGLYYPNDFVQAPEPATLGFVGTGLIGILGSAIRKRARKAS
jgi:hypothetical protein